MDLLDLHIQILLGLEEVEVVFQAAVQQTVMDRLPQEEKEKLMDLLMLLKMELNG